MASQNLKAPLKASDETLAYISLELLSCSLKSNYYPLPSVTLNFVYTRYTVGERWYNRRVFVG